MFSYALSTPTKKGTWTPVEQKPHPYIPYSGEQTQDHRLMTWLIKPKNNQIVPNPQSGRLK
jgi:hypothetical protein